MLTLAGCGRNASVVTTASAQTPGNAGDWTSAQTLEPAQFAKTLADSSSRPAIVCVGFPSLYRGGHLPGAVFHGPASSAEGLANLRAWAKNVPRSTDVVLYCGCCPFAQCPNVRPAFKALSEMGFARVRVLHLPTSFAADWAEKGYAVER